MDQAAYEEMEDKASEVNVLGGNIGPVAHLCETKLFEKL